MLIVLHFDDLVFDAWNAENIPVPIIRIHKNLKPGFVPLCSLIIVKKWCISSVCR